MTDIFLSYKREDEARVAPIIKGLRSTGLSVGSDHDVPAGQARRQSIGEQLENARCVIVVWSKSSVGPPGELVQEVAARGKARGVLVPVRIDRVTEPFGFGEIQSLDLVRWSGNRRNLRFRNLVAAVQAVVAGTPRPRPMTPSRRAAWVGGIGVAAAAILGFASDLSGLQTPLCKIPGVHAVCASQGWGGLPTKAEEILWARRVAGDCEGLRTYLERFPKGAFAEEAGRRLQAAATFEEERWTPEEHRLPLTVRPALAALSNERDARAEALARGPAAAKWICAGYEDGEYRLVSATAEAQGWRCSARGSGFVCGFDGQAVCKVEARRVAQRLVCD